MLKKIKKKDTGFEFLEGRLDLLLPMVDCMAPQENHDAAAKMLLHLIRNWKYRQERKSKKPAGEWIFRRHETFVKIRLVSSIKTSERALKSLAKAELIDKTVALFSGTKTLHIALSHKSRVALEYMSEKASEHFINLGPSEGYKRLLAIMDGQKAPRFTLEGAIHQFLPESPAKFKEAVDKLLYEAEMVELQAKLKKDEAKKAKWADEFGKWVSDKNEGTLTGQKDDNEGLPPDQIDDLVGLYSIEETGIEVTKEYNENGPNQISLTDMISEEVLKAVVTSSNKYHPSFMLEEGPPVTEIPKIVGAPKPTPEDFEAVVQKYAQVSEKPLEVPVPQDIASKTYLVDGLKPNTSYMFKQTVAPSAQWNPFEHKLLDEFSAKFIPKLTPSQAKNLLGQTIQNLPKNSTMHWSITKAYGQAPDGMYMDCLGLIEHYDCQPVNEPFGKPTHLWLPSFIHSKVPFPMKAHVTTPYHLFRYLTLGELMPSPIYIYVPMLDGFVLRPVMQVTEVKPVMPKNTGVSMTKDMLKIRMFASSEIDVEGDFQSYPSPDKHQHKLLQAVRGLMPMSVYGNPTY